MLNFYLFLIVIGATFKWKILWGWSMNKMGFSVTDPYWSDMNDY